MKQEKNNNLPDKNIIVDFLSIIFLSKKIIDILKKDNSFKKAVRELISCCEQIESKQKSNEKTNEFITAYEKITSDSYKKISVSKFDNDDLEDKINYIKTLLSNSYQLNWDDVINELNKKTNVVGVQKKESDDVEVVNAKKVSDDENYQQTNQNYHQYENSEDFLRQNNISLDQIADNLMRQQATMLLNRDIVENKFYQFDSKPRIFKIVKYILYGFWILFFLCFITLLILGFVLGDKPYALKDLASFQGLLDENKTIEYLLNIKYIYYIPKSFSVYLGAFLLIISLLLVFSYVFKEIKNFKNDNIQYGFRSYFSWFIIFVAFLELIFPLFLNSNYHIFANFSNMEKCKKYQFDFSFNNSGETFTIHFDNASIFGTWNAYYVLNIIILVITGLIFLITISLIIIKPKLDRDRINQKIEEYYNDIKSGKIKIDQGDISPTSGFGGLFGGRSFSLF